MPRAGSGNHGVDIGVDGASARDWLTADKFLAQNSLPRQPGGRQQPHW